MGDIDLQPLGYETPASVDPAARGVGVADYGDRLVIAGAAPTVVSQGVVIVGAVIAAAWMGFLVYLVGFSSLRGWRLTPAVVVFTLLASGIVVAGLVCHLRWRERNPQRITEVTAQGIRITDDDGPQNAVEYRRGYIRRVQLVHGRPEGDGSSKCTLQIVLRRETWPVVRAFESDVVVLFNGPAESLREIGVRMRQVLDLPY